MKIERIISNCLESNTFVLSDKGEALIVDCGATLSQVKEVVGESRVVGVLLTHGHYDHALHCKEYANEFGAKVYASNKAPRALQNPEINYGKDFIIDDFSNFELLSGDGSINIGNFRVDFISIPGHSECQVAYLVNKHFFVGDCLFADGIGRIDLATSNKNDMLDSLKKLSEINYEVCHCGHYEDCEQVSKVITVYIKFLSRNQKT